MKITQKLTKHRRKVFFGLGSAVVLAICILAATYSWNYVFNPASSIDFTVYRPNERSLYSSHLVIPGYDEDSFTVFGSKKQAKIGYSVVGNSYMQVVQQKSQDTVDCSALTPCSERQTSTGQRYIYSSVADKELDGHTIERVILDKDETNISITRRTYTDRVMDETTWNSFIDSFVPVNTKNLHFYFIGSEHKWSPV